MSVRNAWYIDRVNPLLGKRCCFVGKFQRWAGYGGAPLELVKQLGALVVHDIGDDADYVIVGEGRAAGRAEAKTRADRLAKQGKLAVLDEVALRELVRAALAGKSFHFAGGFACCTPNESDHALLHKMVEAAGCVTRPTLDAELDYAVFGGKRAKGKTEAERTVKELSAAGAKLRVLDEAQFLDVMRAERSQGGSLDFATFLSNLYGALDHAKLKRALKMLQGERFRLYAKLDDDVLCGVVRSQTGVGTVYAPWLRADGRYGCSQPDLESCLGLNGSPCKHLLVLLLGLTRAAEFEPARANQWIGAAARKRPSLDKELAANAFLQYKGAEAGEIDWRPTETIPEDFYAF